jgi:cation transporter-like permease
MMKQSEQNMIGVLFGISLMIAGATLAFVIPQIAVAWSSLGNTSVQLVSLSLVSGSLIGVILICIGLVVSVYHYRNR